MSTSLSRATNILFSIAFSAFLKNSHLSTSTSIKSKCKVPSSIQCTTPLLCFVNGMESFHPTGLSLSRQSWNFLFKSWLPTFWQICILSFNWFLLTLQAFWLSRGALIGWSCRHFLIVADTSECIAYTVQTERSGKSLQSFTLSLTSRLNSGSGSSDLGDIRN